jgi:hypothetical protein
VISYLDLVKISLIDDEHDHISINKQILHFILLGGRRTFKLGKWKEARREEGRVKIIL